MLPATNMDKIALCISILIFFSSLYQGIDPISLIHVHSKFMNFSRPQLAIEGENFLPYVPIGCDGLATKNFCLPPYCVCTFPQFFVR